LAIYFFFYFFPKNNLNENKCSDFAFPRLNTGTGRAKNCPKLHKTLTQHFRHFMLELIGWKGAIVEHRSMVANFPIVLECLVCLFFSFTFLFLLFITIYLSMEAANEVDDSN
jgi:hypothetical protein